MSHVVYEGAEDREKLGLPPHGVLEFHIEDGDGELFRLYENVPVEVSAGLAKELLGGESERCKGHKFRAATAEERAALGVEPEPEPASKPDPVTPPPAPDTARGR